MRRALALLAGSSFALGAAGCQEQATEVPTRSLERSGQSAFMCLGPPSGAGATPALPLEDCAGVTANSTTNFASGPHLYALVTQLTRGEVAVIDLSASKVVDQNPSTPGASFLPIGAEPVDLVATPGSTAAFVSVAELGHAGIFALPSAQVRPCSGCAAPRLSSWPACSLPVAPGRMVLVADAPNEAGEVRATCDGAYESAPAAGPRGDLGAEGLGRQKLVVALPDLGAVAVIDAQALLDREAGSFEPCAVERFVPLQGDVPASEPEPSVTGPACVATTTLAPASGSFVPRPSGLAFADGHLYVGDLGAPVVHDLAMATPCAPTELDPLRATSLEDPVRVVKTSRVAVTQSMTSKLERFLYAIDVEDGSTMVFDVTPGAPRTPLQRKSPDLNPFTPRDRLKFSSPPRDLLMLQRDLPIANPVTGVAPSAVLCDPEPANSSELGAAYRTDTSNYESGAGPTKLRGTFGFIALMTGQLVVIDIDDLDAPCRVPFVRSKTYGCEVDSSDPLASSGEVSCNVVMPHAPRGANYFISSENDGNHEAGVQALPTLINTKDGALLEVGGARPRMVATLPEKLPDVDRLRTSAGEPEGVKQRADRFGLVVGGARIALKPDGTIGLPEFDTEKQALVMNHEDPRAQVVDQLWQATFEGGIPGFSGKLAKLDLVSDRAPGIYDANSQFCAAGVRSEQALREELAAQGLSAAVIDARAPRQADFVEIASEIPGQNDPHWDVVGGTCTYQQCKVMFGTPDVPTAGRDLRVIEAYSDHLTTEPRDANAPSNELTHCCFPSFVSFRVRLGGQWAVLGGRSGFLHHVVTDPETGVCRPSCDPALARLNGRAFEMPNGTTAVAEGDPRGFVNPMFRFAVVSGTSPTQRGFQFGFTTQNAFPALSIGLGDQDNPTEVNPQSLSLVPTTGELAVPDGSLQGFVLVSTDTLAVSRQIF
jgi:hypothetical protein